MDHKLLTTVRSDHVKQKQLCEKLIDETDPDRRKQIRNDLCLELHLTLRPKKLHFSRFCKKAAISRSAKTHWKACGTLYQ
jgi:hypothetical protein